MDPQDSYGLGREPIFESDVSQTNMWTALASQVNNSEGKQFVGFS